MGNIAGGSCGHASAWQLCGSRAFLLATEGYGESRAALGATASKAVELLTKHWSAGPGATEPGIAVRWLPCGGCGGVSCTLLAVTGGCGGGWWRLVAVTVGSGGGWCGQCRLLEVAGGPSPTVCFPPLTSPIPGLASMGPPAPSSAPAVPTAPARATASAMQARPATARACAPPRRTQATSQAPRAQPVCRATTARRAAPRARAARAIPAAVTASAATASSGRGAARARRRQGMGTGPVRRAPPVPWGTGAAVANGSARGGPRRRAVATGFVRRRGIAGATEAGPVGTAGGHAPGRPRVCAMAMGPAKAISPAPCANAGGRPSQVRCCSEWRRVGAAAGRGTREHGVLLHCAKCPFGRDMAPASPPDTHTHTHTHAYAATGFFFFLCFSFFLVFELGRTSYPVYFFVCATWPFCAGGGGGG